MVLHSYGVATSQRRKGPGHRTPKDDPARSPTIFFGATAARNGLDDLDLFAGTGVLDKVADVDDALVAGAGAVKAGVMRLYGVVVLLGG